MTMLRVTVGSAAYAGVLNVQQSAARMAQLQNQLSSGKRITTPSDDPAGTVRALQLRGAMARNDRYGDNADDAASWLNTMDDAYSSTVTTLQQARTLVLRGLNSGSSDATANGALAAQLDAVRTSLLQVANTTFDGRPIFGGTTASPVAYDTSGNYVGDNGAVTRQIADGQSVDVSAQGPNVFGSPGSDVFTLVANAATALRTDPSTLSPMLDQLDAAIAKVSQSQAIEGARSQQVQAAKSGLTVRGTAMQSELSGVEDVDMADMAMKVAAANTNYQAALQTTAKISQLSLLDFLR